MYKFLFTIVKTISCECKILMIKGTGHGAEGNAALSLQFSLNLKLF